MYIVYVTQTSTQFSNNYMFRLLLHILRLNRVYDCIWNT